MWQVGQWSDLQNEVVRQYNINPLEDHIIITIDGPAGSGKSTVAAKLAERLSIACLDTGAMYRVVTLSAMEWDIRLDDASGLEFLARQCRIELLQRGGRYCLCLDGREITEAIRSLAVTAQTHKVARVPGVRQVLVEQQRRIAREVGSLVTEGRDQGTVAFPEADCKFYLDANAASRAERRQRQLQEQGLSQGREEILTAQQERDRRDTSRQSGPLKVADDAIVVDTTHMTVEQVVERLYGHVKERFG